MPVFALASACVLLPLLVAVHGVFLWRKSGGPLALFAIAIHALGFAASLAILQAAYATGFEGVASFPWLAFPGTGIVFSLGVHIDALSATMLAIVQGFALGVLVVSRWYLHGDRFYGRFFSSFSFFVFSMSGVVIGRYETLMIRLALRVFIAWMPIAASVPKTVDTAVATSAMMIVI